MMPKAGWTRAVVVAWAVVAAATALVGLGSASPAAADPAVVVTPATDLVDGQEVTVELSGFTGGFAGVLQCTAGLGIEGCDTSRLEFPQFAEDGSATLTMEVFTELDSTTGARDCRVVQCVIAAASEPSGIGTTTAALAFDPDAPLLPPPTLTVDPGTGLADGQAVTVEVAGARVGASYVVVQCPASATEIAGCRDGNEWVELDENGNGSREIAVYAAFRTRQGTEVDCRTAPATCDLRLYRQGSDRASIAATDFDPDSPLLTDPTLALEPAGGFVDRQVVVARGSGWTPEGYVQLQQCAVEVAGNACGGSIYTPVGSDGTFAQDVTLDAAVVIGATSVDCRTAPGRCEIRARADDGTGRRYAWLPLDFDPDAPLVPPPVATVTPDIDLVDGQVVEVSASGLIESAGYEEGGSPVGGGDKVTGSTSISLCDAAVPGSQGCSPNAYLGVIHEDGAFTTPYTVASVFTRSSGVVVDCRKAGVTCELRIGPTDNPIRSTAVPLAFTPDGPLRPPPSMTVTPDAGLVDHDIVEVRLDDWGDLSGVSMWLCRPGWIDTRGCTSLPGALAIDVAASSHGVVAGEVMVRPLLPLGSTTFDCRTVPSCDLVAGYPSTAALDPDIPPVDRSLTAVAPVSFDPDGPILSPKITALEPGGPVVDGQIVTLRAEHLTPSTRYQIRQCRDSGELTGLTCDESTLIHGWADRVGEIAPWVVAHRMLTIGDGTTDCTVDDCVLLVEAWADGMVDSVALPMSDGSPPPVDPTDPTDPPAQTPTTTRPPTTSTTTRSATTAATPTSATPTFAG